MLLLTHGLHLTGAPRVAIDLLSAMGEGVEVRTVSADSGPLFRRAAELGPVMVPDLGSAAAAGIVRRLSRRLARTRAEWGLRSWKPDVIYANSIASLPLAEIVKLPPAPVVLHVHELDSYLDYYANRHRDLLLEWPARYVAVSGPVAEALVRLGVRREKISVIHECVRSQEYADDADQRIAVRVGELNNGRPFIVGGAGRVDLRKGPTLWLQAVAELARLAGPIPVRAEWVGVDDDLNGRQFRMMADRLGLGGIVTFTRVTSDPLACFRRFDVLAMTSWEDPCPLVVIECMMNGVPVACFSGGGGAPEQVGDTGFVAEGFSPTAMAAELLPLVRSPNLLVSKAVAARRRVIENFTDKVQAPKMQLELDRTMVSSVPTPDTGRSPFKLDPTKNREPDCAS